MQLIQCSRAEHAAAILEIFNEAIANSTALYDYRPRTAESMLSWFDAKSEQNFPVIGAVDPQGRLMGFASYDHFRARPACKYTLEHSVYVHQSHRGKGVGRALLERLISLATEQQYHTLIGAVDMNNRASIELHERLGFVHSGTIREAAFKFGRWLDLGFYQLLLPAPERPIED